MDTPTTPKKPGRKPRAASETMTRRELAAAIYKKLRKDSVMNRVSAQTVFDVVQASIDCLNEAIVAGKHIEFRDFGVFEAVTRRSRLGRNPNKPGVTVVIPPRRTVKFRPSRKLLESLAATLPAAT
jgi:nucleoid DNA-binding protein